jgi:hypothetical protein
MSDASGVPQGIANVWFMRLGASGNSPILSATAQFWSPYCGRIYIFKKKINLSTSLAGQVVGVKEVDDGIWQVSDSC